MASAEVNMQDMSEVVIMTLPDPGEPPGDEVASVVEEDKTLLLATDTREEVLDEAADQAEAEASPAESLSRDQAVVVKLSEQVDVEAEVFYPITCADVKASLVWKKFVCPGINVKCVQFNQQLISPKEFVCLAGKSTLKDWKRAIRLNGTMLRKIMDCGDLDFYQHSQVCSNTCRSTKIDLVGAKVSISEPAADLLSSSAASADLNGSAAAFPEATEEPSEWVTAIGEDSLMFWRALKEAGLLEEVVEDFQTELQVVLKGLQERVCEPPLQVKDAELLNNIVQNFGMLDLVKKVLAGHKSQMDRYREQYSRSLAALEQQCDEHRKQAKELKNKSQHLNNVLMTLAPAPSPPPAKRPRLTRAISGPAAVSPAPAPAPVSTHMALPLSPLPGLPLGKLLTVGGGGGAGRFTLLTSSLSGPDLAANASNLSVLSVAAGQEGGGRAGGGVVKVLGPQFQVVTVPASTLQNASTLQSVVTVQQGSSISVMHDLLEAAHTDGGDGAQTDGGEGAQTDGIDGAQTDGVEGALTDGVEGAQTDGAQTDGIDGAQTDGVEGALTDGVEGGQTDGAQTDGIDGAQTDGVGGALTDGVEGALTDGAQTDEVEGAQTDGAQTDGGEQALTDGAQTDEVEGAQTDGGEGAQTDGAQTDGVEGAQTDGAQTDGVEGAQTDGAQTDGVEGAQTDGAQTDGVEGAQTDGAQTDGAQTDGAQTDGGETG